MTPVVVALIVTACGGEGDGAGADGGGVQAPSRAGAIVTIATFSFEPDPIEVGAGTTLTFVNEDAIDHTVTAGTREAPTPDRFDGVLAREGATFDLTLEEPGTYAYFCTIHEGPGMTGSIEVT